MVEAIITENSISYKIPPHCQGEDGAELHFFGRVRKDEKGQPITGLYYDHYEGMAQTELQKLSEEVASSYEISRLYCVHRVGLVPVGEASLQVIIWSPHRVAGLEAISAFIMQLKQDVPIWKEAVFTDGRRVVVECCH